MDSKEKDFREYYEQLHTNKLDTLHETDWLVERKNRKSKWMCNKERDWINIQKPPNQEKPSVRWLHWLILSNI